MSETRQIVLMVADAARAIDKEWQNVTNLSLIDDVTIAADHLYEQGPPICPEYRHRREEPIQSDQYFVPLYELVRNSELANDGIGNVYENFLDVENQVNAQTSQEQFDTELTAIRNSSRSSLRESLSEITRRYVDESSTNIIDWTPSQELQNFLRDVQDTSSSASSTIDNEYRVGETASRDESHNVPSQSLQEFYRERRERYASNDVDIDNETNDENESETMTAQAQTAPNDSNDDGNAEVEIDLQIVRNQFARVADSRWTKMVEKVEWLSTFGKKVVFTHPSKVIDNELFSDNNFSNDNLYVVLLRSADDYLKVQRNAVQFFGPHVSSGDVNAVSTRHEFNADGFENVEYTRENSSGVTFDKYSGIGFHRNDKLIAIVPDHQDNIIYITTNNEELGNGNIQFLANYLNDETLIKFMTGQVDRAAMNIERFKNMLRGNVTRQIGHVERDIRSVDERVAEYSRELTSQIRQRAEHMTHLDFLRTNGDEQYDALIEEIDDLPSLDGVESVQIGGSNIVVKTDFLHFDGPDGNEYELGEIEITIGILSSEPVIRFKNLTRTAEGFDGQIAAPHIYRTGRACFGNLEVPVLKLFAAYELTNGVSLLIDFLRSINYQDYAGKYYKRWKLVSETEEDYFKRLVDGVSI